MNLCRPINTCTAILDKILPWRRTPEQTLTQIDASAPVEKSGGWSAAFPNPALSTAFGSYTNNSGIPVTPFSALQASAVYACVKVLSEDVAKLPVRIRRAQHASGKTSWVDENSHPLNRLLRTPNSWQAPFEFWSYIVSSQQLWGNACVAIIRNGGGAPKALIPLLPSRTTVLLNESGNIYY